MAAPAAPAGRGPTYRVMVVDDYPDAAKVVSSLLEIFGHDVRTATTGRAALEIARTFELEIALIDVGLPDLSGLEVARALREQFPARRMFLAAITGWGQPSDRVRALAAGFDHHVLKPIDAAIIRRIMHLGTVHLAADRVPPAVTPGAPDRT